jgi:hypothetical protein
MLNYALGGVDLDVMLASSNPRAAMGLSIVYQFAMSMVLMNLLIGVMCSSLTKVGGWVGGWVGRGGSDQRG